jgi:zinc protease
MRNAVRTREPAKSRLQPGLAAPLCLLMLSVAAAFGQKVPGIPGLDPPTAATPAKPAAGRGGKPAATAAPAPAPAPAAAVAPGPKDLKFPPARVVQMPALTSFTLANGMKVYLQEDRELPFISGTVLVRTGSLFDPPERIGLAQLTGTVLRSGGTALKTGEQLDDMLESIGGAIESTIGASQGSVSFFALKENSDAILVLLKEILTQPGFRQDKLELARLQLRNAIAHRNDTPDAITARELRGLVFGKDTPFGWDPQYGTIDRITRGDVRNFYQRYFFPANLMLGICGDFDSAQMKATIEKLFADWTVPQKPVPELPKVKNAPTPGIFLAEKKDATQTYFTIGHLGGQYNDKDFAAMEIAANVLGGPQGRLAERMRAKLGNPTEIRVSWGAMPGNPGLFEITGNTRSISTLDTIKAIQEEVERMRGAEVSEEEFRLAREAALSKSIFEADSKVKIFTAMLSNEYYGYPKDFIQEHQKALQAVTRADLLRAVKEHLIPANLSVVVGGNPMLFGDSLEKLGPLTTLDITIPQPKAELAESTDASLAQGKQLLQKAQAAVGGGDRLAAVRDYSMLAQYQIDPSVSALGGSKIVQTDRWVSPTTFRQDSSMPAGAVAAYTDGKIGWISTPQGWGALAGTQAKQVFGDLFRVYFRLLLSDRLDGRTVNAIDDNTIQISDATGQVASVEFDAQTGLPRKVSYDTPQAAGPPIYSEDVYDDFRDIGGVKIPFKLTINQGGRRFADVVVNEYKINVGIKPTDLAKRPQ